MVCLLQAEILVSVLYLNIKDEKNSTVDYLAFCSKAFFKVKKQNWVTKRKESMFKSER